MTLIDRDELLKFKQDVYDYEGHLLYAVPTGIILCLPTVESATARKKGRWDILASCHPVDRWQADIQCPICGFKKESIWVGYFPGCIYNQARNITKTYAEKCKKPNFCEKCGADLREVEKDG